MKVLKNLRIIGTSHIAKQSIKEIENAFEEDMPEIIAVELDKKRLPALMSSKKQKKGMFFYNLRRVGIKGFIFSLIGAYAEKKLGEIVGVTPGADMKKAVLLARKNKKEIALIDQDIEITLKKLSKAITWKEKWNFVKDIFKAVFGRKKVIEFDLKKVPDKKLIEKMIGEVKKGYPNVYRVLVEERNEFMAKKLKVLIDRYPDKKILAVVGAGHEDEIADMVEIESSDMMNYSYSYGYTV